jgi:hypothetical protein
MRASAATCGGPDWARLGADLVGGLAVSGIFLMAPLPWRVLMVAFAAAGGFALLLDQLKRPVLSVFRV